MRTGHETPGTDSGAQHQALSVILTEWLSRHASHLRERELREALDLFDALAEESNQ